MSRRASKGVKRPRQQQGEEEDAQPLPLHLTAHPTLPLPLLSVPQMFRGMCVSAQLCKAHGASLFSNLNPRVNRRVSRPFAGSGFVFHRWFHRYFHHLLHRSGDYFVTSPPCTTVGTLT